MQLEYGAIMQNDTWTLCDLPPSKKAIGTKWVYKKRKLDGTVDRHKARLVTKGYGQEKSLTLMKHYCSHVPYDHCL